MDEDDQDFSEDPRFEEMPDEPPADEDSDDESPTPEPVDPLDKPPRSQTRGHAWSREHRKHHSAAMRRAWQRRKGLPIDSESSELPELPDPSPQRAGVRAYRAYNLLPADVREQHDAFVAEAFTDLGGEDQLSALTKGMVHHLAQTHAICILLEIDIHLRGVLNAKGQIRSTAESLLKAQAMYDRLAARLGLERRTKQVAGTTIESWIESHATKTPDGDGSH